MATDTMQIVQQSGRANLTFTVTEAESLYKTYLALFLRYNAAKLTTIPPHVSRVVQTCFYHRRRIRAVRRQLGRDVTVRLVTALVLTHRS